MQCTSIFKILTLYRLCYISAKILLHKRKGMKKIPFQKLFSLNYPDSQDAEQPSIRKSKLLFKHEKRLFK